MSATGHQEHGEKRCTSGMEPFRPKGLQNIVVLLTTFIRCLSSSLWSGLPASAKVQHHANVSRTVQSASMTDGRSGFLPSVSRFTGYLVATAICFTDCLTFSVTQAAGSNATLSQVTTVSQS